MNSHIPETERAFDIAAYEQLFGEKHHYDNLSWVIGSTVLVSSGALIAYLPSVSGEGALGRRIAILLFIWILLLAWHSIYTRNRLWVEAINETIRDFERKYGVRGAGITFMETSLTKRIHHPNTGLTGSQLEETLVDGSTRAIPAHTQIMTARSMHVVINALVLVVGLVAAGTAFLIP